MESLESAHCMPGSTAAENATVYAYLHLSIGMLAAQPHAPDSYI